MADALKPIADWIRHAMRFIDLCEADVLDYLDRDLTPDAERLTKEGYALFGEMSDERCLADLEHLSLALTASDDLVALGVAGIQRRDAEGWGDEDEDQINRELARAVLMAVLQPPESTSAVVRRIVPEGQACGPVVVSEADHEALEAAIARDKAALAAKLPTDHDAIAQINEAVRRLQDLGWKDPVHCPKDGSTFDGIEIGSTGIHPFLYLGTWPKGDFWLQADGDLWPSRPILGRPRADQAQPDPRWTLDNGKPWTRDDSVTFDVLGLVGEIELEIPTRPEHVGTVFERLNEGRNVRRLTVTDIASWTDDQVRDAELWAGAIYTSASDNDDVEIPPTPEHLTPWLERKARS